MARRITRAQLVQTVSYDPETGQFKWLRSKSGRRGDVGSITPQGYRCIGLNYRSYLSHHLAWLYMTGKWPKGQIDHINGKRSDNAFKNLREANTAINKQNLKGPQKNNKVGMLGVSRQRNRFVAHICVGGKDRHIGSFNTPEEAHAAYLKKKRAIHPGNTL